MGRGIRTLRPTLVPYKTMGLPGKSASFILSVSISPPPHPLSLSNMVQKVTQSQTATFMLEKETVTLNRVYEASSYSCYLFWYKHQVGNDFPYRSGVLQ